MSEIFSRRDGELFIEELPIRHIVEQVGTPAYLYSLRALRRNYDALDAAFEGVPHTICYSAKANMNLAVLRALVLRGAGVDVTSGGELFRALRAGADPRRVVYSGVGKRDDEIDAALAAGIKMINVESRAELRHIDAVAAKRGVRAQITFRVNPDVDPKTHPYISTGLRTSKFGVPIGEAVEAYAEAKALEHVEVIGVDCHIGSQLTDLSPLADALGRVHALILELRSAGHEISVIDVGGGLGVTYAEEVPPTPRAYADTVLSCVGSLGCEIVLEPGRSIAAPSGLFVTRVLYQKSNDGKHFVVVDGGMNDLLRPALYQAYQRAEPVGPAKSGARRVDLVGPVCESADFLARDRSFPPVEEGDLIAFHASGAYGFAMASNYNGRPRPVEVMVSGDRFDVVRQRETLEDLVRGESMPGDLLEDDAS